MKTQKYGVSMSYSSSRCQPRTSRSRTYFNVFQTVGRHWTCQFLLSLTKLGFHFFYLFANFARLKVSSGATINPLRSIWWLSSLGRGCNSIASDGVVYISNALD